MAVCSYNPIVYVLHKESLECPILLSLDILQVISMNNADNMVKFIGPTFTMMIPVQVFRFFKDSNVGIF